MASKTRYKSRSTTPAPVTEDRTDSTSHTSPSTHGPTICRNLVVGDSAPHSFTSQSQSQSRTYDRRYASPRSPYMTHFSPHLQHATIPENQDISREGNATSSVREADYSNFCQSKPPAEIDYSSTDSLVSTASTDTTMPEWVPPSPYSSQTTTSTLPMFIEPTYHNSHLQHIEQTAGKPTPLQPSFPGPQFPSPLSSIPAVDDRHRPRQLSIQSILSSPGLPTPNTNGFVNGHGGLKRKKDEEEGAAVRAGEGVKEVKGLEGIEDPDVRLAAEALGDLRADFNHSAAQHRRSPSLNRAMHPSNLHLGTSTSSSSTSSSTNPTSLNSPLSPSSSLPHPQYSPSLSPVPLSEVHPIVHAPPQQTQQKPLIDLLSASSPIINTVVQRSAAAYSGTKNYSPKFRYAAEIGEKFVGAGGNLVGKKMGGDRLEGWVRSKLTSSFEHGKEDDKENDVEKVNIVYCNGDFNIMNGYHEGQVGKKKRKTSVGEVVNGNCNGNGSVLQPHIASEQENNQATQPQANWQTRVMISTSGLTVAMSEESFKSLQFCFSWLRAANGHLSKMIESLQHMLVEYEASLNSTSLSLSSSSSASSSSSSLSSSSSDQGVLSKVLPERCETRRQRFLKAIETVKEDVLSTIKKVISVVDDYAGGALTGEARSMVKRQLLLLPRRITYVLTRSSVGTNPAVQGVVRRLTSGVPDHNQEHDGAEEEGANGTTVNGTELTNGDVEKGQTTQVHPHLVDPRVNANKVLLIAKEGFEMMQNVMRLVEETLLSAEEWCEKFGRRPGNIPPEAARATQQEQEQTLEDELDVEMAEDNGKALIDYGEMKVGNGRPRNGEYKGARKDKEGDVEMMR